MGRVRALAPRPGAAAAAAAARAPAAGAEAELPGSRAAPRVDRESRPGRDRAREPRRRPGWLLQGLVVRRRCGYAFFGPRWSAAGWAASGRPTTAPTAAQAPPRTAIAGQAVCDNRSVRRDRLERAVWDESRVALEDPERVATERRRWLADARRSPGEAAATDLERRIAALRRGVGRLIDAYAEGLIERGELEPRVERMRQRSSQSEKGRQTMVANAEAERGLDAARRPPGGVRREGTPRSPGAGLGGDARGRAGHGPAGRGRPGPRRRRLPDPAPSHPRGDERPCDLTPPSGRVRQDCRGRHRRTGRRADARGQRRVGRGARTTSLEAFARIVQTDPASLPTTAA